MRNIKIGELKAQLSKYIRSVRAGEALTVMDRATPVAVISPYEDQGTKILWIEPVRTWKELMKMKVRPLPKALKRTMSKALSEDRESR